MECYDFLFLWTSINIDTRHLKNLSQLIAKKANLESSSVCHHLLSDIYSSTRTLPDHRIYSYHWSGRLPGHSLYGYCTYWRIQNGTWDPSHKQSMREFVKIVFALISVPQSDNNFIHITSAQLLWHVQNYDLIWYIFSYINDINCKKIWNMSSYTHCEMGSWSTGVGNWDCIKVFVDTSKKM